MRRLVVDSALEAGGRPVNELDGTLGLDGRDSCVDILGDDITTVHEAARHVLSVAGVTLGHHGCRLESGVSDLRNGQLFMLRLGLGDNRSVRRKHEVDARVGHKVGLELVDIDVQSTVESQGCSKRRNHLRDETVEVGVRRPGHIQRATADIVDGLIVENNSDVGVLEKRVCRQDAVVRLDNSGGDLGRRVDVEPELGLLAIVNGKTLKQERSKTRPGSSSDRVEDEEALETGTGISETTNAVKS
mmetsp:Transcript_25987/g.41153  ORF Transcript_25987/g.41153 Transcript_25987/m.41153 type:complete len:245 (+) Transcript_25987:382-1116(+)